MSVIPFASDFAPNTTTSRGKPVGVNLIGFGHAAMEPITITGDLYEGGTVNIMDVALNHSDFSMPFDGSVDSLYFSATKYSTETLPFATYPTMGVFAAPADSNLFSLLKGTAIRSTKAFGPGRVPVGTVVSGGQVGLDVPVSPGTRLFVAGWLEIPGDTLATRRMYVFYAGGVGISRKE